jgi:adenylylsulfate kinase-like enzyme
VSSVLVVTGPTGVGKTTVAYEMTEVLDERGLAFGFYDPDAIFAPCRTTIRSALGSGSQRSTLPGL